MNSKKTPMRMCLGCRQMMDKRSLLRIVRTEQGLVVDLSGKLNGRGAYVCKSQECFAKCCKTKAFTRQLGFAPDEMTTQQICDIIAKHEEVRR